MSSIKANILQLTLSFRPGGRKNAIKTLAHGLRGAVDRCDLCCLDELGCDPMELEGLFNAVDALKRKEPGQPKAARKLLQLCTERDMTLIHAHDAASQFVAAVVRMRRPKTKLIMTFHRSLGFESVTLRDRLRNAFACWRSQAVVTGSRERRDHFLAENYVSASKMELIPFGVDVNAYRSDQAARAAIRERLQLRESSVLVGAIGHYGSEKGIDQAIGAYRSAMHTAPDADCVLAVVGNGTPEQCEVMNRLASETLPGKVILAGYQKNVRDWYSAFDIFLHAPRQEAFGLVLIEAMSAGLPVVASGVGGVPDIVRNDQTGFLCPTESPSSLAESLLRLIRDQALRSRLGAAALDVATREYSASLCTKRYLELYQRVLSGQKPARSRV